MYTFLRKLLSGRPSAAPAHTRFRSRLSLEALEDRAVPAMMTAEPTYDSSAGQTQTQQEQWTPPPENPNGGFQGRAAQSSSSDFRTQ